MVDRELILKIQDNRVESTKQKSLSTEILDLAYQEKWFHLWVPKEFGGREMDLISGCELLEELAYEDGSLAWTITLCSGANMFVGFLDQAIAADIFLNDRVCFGGSGQVNGSVVTTDGGYILSGVWPYATGAPHLTHFTANVAIDTNEDVVVKSFLIPKEQVLVHYDWNTFGLESTASHSFSIKDVFVPEAYTFEIDAESSKHSSILFQYPFKTFAELTLFVNYLGMARRFSDLVQKFFFEKSASKEWNERFGKDYFRLLDSFQQKNADSSKEIYDLLDISWSNLKNSLIDEDVYIQIAEKTRLHVSDMKQLMLELYTKCGIRAASIDNELNSVFRNFFTATQHAWLHQ